MVSIIGLFIQLFFVIATAVIKVVLFLIRRFDITNSLLVSGVVQLVTIHNPISTGLRWVMFLGIVIVSFALQHRFKVFRFIFAAASVFAACVLAYGWIHYETVKDRNIAMGISMAVVAVLNLLSWMGISADECGTEVSA